METWQTNACRFALVARSYGLAMLEIPVIMALVFRRYDMELLDPLPGMNYKEAFGVVSPDSKPVRVRYQRRR